MKKITVLTGAGVSAESGINTFRDSGGLWENHDVMEVASIDGWRANPNLVLDFYNQRRRRLYEVRPNAAHEYVAKLEEHFDVVVVTQNIDNLHERAGSTNVIHLHGELNKARSVLNENLIVECEKDILLGDLASDGGQLRPHIVWFGEMVPLLEVGAQAVMEADHVIIVGTSLQVYPAAGLVGYARPEIPIAYIDPNPAISYELNRASNLTVIPKVATEGMHEVYKELIPV
ncbi:MAG: NAD-dependent deacylase [Bacteroidia bacterium]|nr:NAD-dependent deacylase [Bacteroidia bacterium]